MTTTKRLPQMKLYPSGRRFGRLSVVRHVGFDGQWRTYECLCDCGATITASSKLLVAHKASCGCLLRESRSNNGKRNFKDISGLRSGRLVAMCVAPERGVRGDIRWLCRCDCGNERTARGSQITGQTLVSCGCASGQSVRKKDIRAASSAYRAHRRKTDIKYALSNRIGNKIRDALKGRKKSRTWETIVGYTKDDLLARLESTMPPGATWDDFLSGQLHIDHIVPLSVHNYETETDPDFKRAWALSNLQLLPARVNMQKHNTLTRPFQPSFAWGT